MVKIFVRCIWKAAFLKTDMYFHTDEVLIYPGPGLYKENRLSCVSLQVLNYPTHNYVSMLVFKKMVNKTY